METPEAPHTEVWFPFTQHAQTPPDAISCSVSWKHAHPTESHTLPSLIALVTGIAKDASRMNQALETEAGENGSWEDAQSWTYPAGAV